MKIDDYQKIQEEIEKEFNQNNDKINDLGWRASVLSANRFISTLEMVGMYGMFPLIVLILGSSLLFSKFPIIPLEFITLINLGVSGAIGVTLQQRHQRKAKLKEKLHSFSKAEKDSELLEEKTRYEIELEQLKSKNEALNQLNQSVESNIDLLQTMSERYDFAEKKDDREQAVISTEIEAISSVLEQENKNLEQASTRKFLSDNFWQFRDKTHSGFAPVMLGMGCGLMAMICCGMPNIAFTSAGLPISFTSVIINVFAPMIAGSAITGIGLAKYNKAQRKIFDKLNAELGDNQILTKPSIEEDKALENELARAISNVYNKRLQLESEIRALGNCLVITNETDQEQIVLSEREDYNQAFEIATDIGVTEIIKDETGPRLVKK